MNEEGTQFESWQETVDRVIGHSRRLWEDAGGVPDDGELSELNSLFRDRKVLPAGRTLWLGGTELARERSACQFNCAYTSVRTVYDAVDVFWLLLQGCGVGFSPVPGTLTGFQQRVECAVVPSTSSPDDRGSPYNSEEFDADTGTWTIRIGDSAEAWAKSLGKILLHPHPAEHLVLDFSEIRGSGKRLSGYGWICNGYKPLAKAYTAIVDILNSKANQLLSEMDILDVVNHLGTVLSSRRSAQIALLNHHNQRWRQFARAKDRYWERGNHHRQQSNNSLVFWEKPDKAELRRIFDLMVACGGSEPGFINGKAAQSRAPWFSGVNPCGEILLTDKGFCNLVEINIAAFEGDLAALMRATYLVARHNYRQTCVNLDDGVLQPAWHQNNESLRLCGVSLTGIVNASLTDYELKELRNQSVLGAHSMADEIGLPRSKNVTTGKPSGTLSKIMDTTEGIHRPLGQYMFNWVSFSSHDPLVERAKAAGYKVLNHPNEPTSRLICFPVAYPDVEFDIVDGKAVNIESAADQLRRYFRFMRLWCDQNMSNTISYDPSEIPEIVDILHANWDDYVGVSFLFRNDPTKSALDLGYEYLPQDVVTKEVYEKYVNQIQAIDFSGLEGIHEIEAEDCAGGACPVR